MNSYVWPDTPPATRAEVLDRSRLVADLEVATDPHAELSVLLMVGVPRDLGTAAVDPALVMVIEELGRWIGDLIGDRGSIYCTRGTEVCALVAGTVSELRDVLADLRERLTPELNAMWGISIGFVALPEETADAATALTLVDHRLAARGLGLAPGSPGTQARGVSRVHERA